jgi:hypothetical protein
MWRLSIDLRDLMIPPSNERFWLRQIAERAIGLRLGLPHFGRPAAKMYQADLPVQEPLETHTLSAHFTDTQSQ